MYFTNYCLHKRKILLAIFRFYLLYCHLLILPFSSPSSFSTFKKFGILIFGNFCQICCKCALLPRLDVYLRISSRQFMPSIQKIVRSKMRDLMKVPLFSANLINDIKMNKNLYAGMYNLKNFI